MITLPDTSYYLEPWNDEVLPCDTTLEGWAEWLSKPAEDWNRPEPARDGETFTASVVSWDVDIVATRREGGEWTFNREIPANASILAVRFGEGLGWNFDSVAHDEQGVRDVLREVGGTEVGDTELIAVGIDQPQATVVYRANPPRMEVVEVSDPLIKTAIGPTILLQSGAYFDLLDPDGSEFTIEDIAHGLAHTCRFAGQCRSFYSVAEHCYHASFLVPAEDAVEALLHDAAEAFIGDVTRPLKALLPEYKAIERRIERAIGDRFGLAMPDSPASIKHADKQMLAIEQAHIMPAHADSWSVLEGIDVPDIKLRLWAPEEAKRSFMDRFAQLSARCAE